MVLDQLASADVGRRKPHNCKSMVRLLEGNGWTRTIGGKHVYKMVKPGHRPITVPIKNGQDYGPRLTADILRQAGLKGGT